MASTVTLKNRANRELGKLPTYCEEIPLDEIFAIVRKHLGEVVDEEGLPWSGLLLGDEGCAYLKIADRRMALTIGWYKMNSGRYELTVVVS